MKLNTDASSEHFWLRHYRNLAVLLDDIPQVMVSEADDVEGYVIRTCLNAYGGVIVEGDTIKTERAEGRVTFVGTAIQRPLLAEVPAQGYVAPDGEDGHGIPDAGRDVQ